MELTSILSKMELNAIHILQGLALYLNISMMLKEPSLLQQLNDEELEPTVWLPRPFPLVLILLRLLVALDSQYL